MTTTTRVYELDCSDCSFETTVEGDFYDVYEVIDDHQEDQEDYTDHFVNFSAVATVE